MSLTRGILLVIGWACLVALSLYFFITNVAVYFTGFRSKVFGDTLFHNQVWVVMH